jgi:hypothetical protein
MSRKRKKNNILQCFAEQASDMIQVEEIDETRKKSIKEKIVNVVIWIYSLSQITLLLSTIRFNYSSTFCICWLLISMVIHVILYNNRYKLAVHDGFCFFDIVLLVLGFGTLLTGKGIFFSDERSIGIGELVETKDNSLIYKLHKQNGDEVFWEVEDLLGNTDSLRQVKQIALLSSNPKRVLDWFPSESEMLLYKNIVESKSDSLKSDLSSLDYALYNPLKYYDKYGLTMVYNAVVVSSNNYGISVLYNDVFGNTRTATIRSLEDLNIEKGETVVIKENLNKYINNKIEIATDIKLDNVKTIGVMFTDTIVSYEFFFSEAPQYKKLFSEPYYDILSGNYVGVANYWSTESYGGRVHYEYPVLFYRDQYGCVYKKEFPNKIEHGDLKQYLNGVLIDLSSKQIINKVLTTKDLIKYKYPILMFHGQEIGNNSYGYAKIETDRYIQNYGLSLAYLAHVDSKQRDVVVDKVNLTFKDIQGKIQTTVCHIPQTYKDYDTLIIYSNAQGYRAAELKFDTEANFEKIRQGRAYIFRDTIVTERELLNDIPQMIFEVEKIKFKERNKQ